MGLNVQFVLQKLDSIKKKIISILNCFKPKDYSTKEKEVDKEKRTQNLKDSIYYVHLWYESYQKMNQFFAGLTLGIIFFTATFLLNIIVSGNINDLNLFDFSYIKIGIILLGLSFIFYSMTIIFDYNWFIEGLNNVMKTEVDFSHFGELFNYRNTHISMSIFGKLDQICSYIATALLLIGILFYGLGAWKILSIYLRW